MARRRGNMLEAFQVSREKSLQAQMAAQKAMQRDDLVPSAETVAQRLKRKTKGLGGAAESELDSEEMPRAQTQAPVQAPEAQDLGGVGSPARSVVDFPDPGTAAVKRQLEKSITLQMGPLGLLASALAMILVAFWGGYRIGERQGSNNALAGIGTGVEQPAWMDRSPVPQDLPDPGALPGEGGYAPGQTGDLAAEGQVSAADLAFEDPSNHFTLVVDQHNDNDLGWERAVASYQYLKAQGLPAVYPRIRGDVIYLLVGASPDRASQNELLKLVHALSYPGSQDRTFSTAYQERIENFF
ncbi:MAG: hypothetical protein GY930_01650 [bacterium]|nr:hypothetical protein [bacterium]